MRTSHITKETWPCGVSDGLCLPCALCGARDIQFDYEVESRIWEQLVPREHWRDVVCLPCLDRLGRAAGIQVGHYILSLQFIGSGFTVEFLPAHMFVWGSADAQRAIGNIKERKDGC